MRLDIYQAETALIAQEQSVLLDEARERLLSGHALSKLEQNGILHAIQLLVENSIVKDKHLLKAAGKQVPFSAYYSFSGLADIDIVEAETLKHWNAAIGLRNCIVHDYMNIDMDKVLDLVKCGQYCFVTDFLLAPVKISANS